ncbi:phosphoribosylformylglycinamidine cyclo-ligase [Rubinisphaera brasiliensis]|uniref:Phosphoribosylformylglycinamidine cyclo-ligase n=1 Tax=Rubinisphaera brasiliensis (strain ATCC 49424 / DSM 5305 / JCM 21570 / IAM 15109 / NBRC 103401 / IFAM 1448) TaxID=756272 RepID=F0SGD8_RUBBR|nr:phosphoribosylformylglycinamidine cyclo-ligase [Rubinisphaera brasiliensis]ADY60537.1 phosphoribosylformylglycinamidine cyclo-ligase [Rubinisphaera brasiliensis DSM 5305]
MTSFDYKSSGVDLDIYQESMKRVARHVGRTKTARVMPLSGGFAGLFRLFGDQKSYKDPVLVSGTDGVGTKVKIAQKMQKFDTIGIDLVAMCVNDCLCIGSEPLFFLDYLAMGQDDPQLTEQLVKGIAEACEQTGMALLGGETAIMPDVYGKDDFDLAGFSVAVVDREQIIDGKQIQAGDVAIGIPSSGVHSNGFSLVRKIVFEHAGLTVDSHVDELGGTVGETLLTPTRLYPAVMAPLLNDETRRAAISGIAHITGGGLGENLERILPEGVAVEISSDAWTPPAVFPWLQKLGNVSDKEMQRVFNMGIGLVLLVRQSAAPETLKTLQASGEQAVEIGQVTAGERQVVVR